MTSSLRNTLCLLGALAPAAAALQAPADDRLFVEVETARDAYFLREEVPVAVRVGVERAFLEEGLVQLFAVPLDLPVQLEADWFADTACAEARPVAPPPADAPRLALGEEVARARRVADRDVDGRAFAVVELERRLLPTCAGSLVLAGPDLRFAWATAFDVDALGDRVPRDRVEGALHGPGRVVTIRPLPEDDRPSDFSGAVGRFEVTASADRQDLPAGESLALTLVVTGEGDLAAATSPRLDRLEGFRELGRVEVPHAEGRAFVYDLQPSGRGAVDVPAIPFVYFDPAPPGAYRVATTAPVPLVVRAAEEPRAPVAPVAAPDEGPEADPGGADFAAWVVPVVVGAFVLFGAVGLVLARRRRPVDVRGPALRVAAETHHRAVADGADPTDALHAFLGAYLDAPAASTVGHDLAARLEARGASPELAARAAAVVEDLHAERYGGVARAGDAAEVTALVDALAGT